MSVAFAKAQPYGDWGKCLVDFATFDSYPEFQAAVALDSSTGIDWWLRNDPPCFRINTPIGWFEPDFIYGRSSGIRGVLEVKGDFLWQGPESPEEIKAESACEWVRAQNALAGEGGTNWEFALVIDDDVADASHIDALRAVAKRKEP